MPGKTGLASKYFVRLSNVFRRKGNVDSMQAFDFDSHYEIRFEVKFMQSQNGQIKDRIQLNWLLAMNILQIK
jgi:hypothetical protein